MKQWQFYSMVLAIVVSFFTLASYGFNISSFASGLSARVGFLEIRGAEDRVSIKEDLNYIRSRVDEITKQLNKNNIEANCGQCKDH